MPAKWRNPKPWSPELLKAREDYSRIRPRKVFGNYPSDATLGASPEEFLQNIENTWIVTDEQKTSISAFLADQTKALTAAKRLVTTSDFVIDCMYPPPPVEALAYAIHQDHAGLMFEVYVQQEKDVATSTALNWLNIAADSRRKGLHAAASKDMVGRPAFALAFVATTSGDIVVARRTLDAMNAIDISPIALGTSNSLHLQYMDTLLTLAREGFPVNFSFSAVGPDLESYVKQIRRKYAAAMLKTPGLSTVQSENLMEYAKLSFLGFPSSEEARRRNCLDRFFPQIRELSYCRSMAWYIDHYGLTVSRDDLGIIYFDLARLRIAVHLFQQEQGRYPNSSAELVPSFMPKEPIDPSTAKPYTWDPTRKQFFAGPMRYFDKLYGRRARSGGIL